MLFPCKAGRTSCEQLSDARKVALVASHRVLVVLGADGGVSGDLDAAGSVVIADVQGMEVRRWRPHAFHWAADIQTDRRQAHVVAFVHEQLVEAVVVGAVSADLRHALAEEGVPVFVRSGISARAAVVSAGSVLDLAHGSSEAGHRNGG